MILVTFLELNKNSQICYSKLYIHLLFICSGIPVISVAIVKRYETIMLVLCIQKFKKTTNKLSCMITSSKVSSDDSFRRPINSWLYIGFPESVTFLNFFGICFSEIHIQKGLHFFTVNKHNFFDFIGAFFSIRRNHFYIKHIYPCECF